MQTVVVLTGLAAVYCMYSCISGLRRNIAVAKSTGLPYIVARTHIPLCPLSHIQLNLIEVANGRTTTACSPINLLWQITHKLWLPIIKSFPESWWEEWLE